MVCFGIAFPVLVLVAEHRYLRTGDPLYRTLARRWSRIMLALLAFHNPNAVVKGLNIVPLADQPPVNVVRFSFQTMVGIGTLLALLALVYLYLRFRHRGLPPALAMVCVSAVAGLATLALCWRRRFGLARLTAALAVAAVVGGWAAAQAPRFLPGLTVTQAAADRSTLIALIIGVACGSVVLIPSLALLLTLFLRGQLDTPESHDPMHPDAAPAGAAAPSPTARSSQAGPAAASLATASPAGVAPTAPPARLWGAAAVVGLVAGTGLLVFLDPAWAHGLGVACLVLCAVAVFRLASSPPAP